MNKRQKETLKNELKNEKAVLNDIKAVYEQAMQDIEQKIEKMQARISANPEDTAAIYQKQFQQALKKQVSATLDVLNSNQYDKIQDYLQNCYEDAFIGTMYDLQGQGIPLVLPINQEEVVTAIQHDTKLKKPLYEALGYNVDNLKKIIASEISRGFANGYMYTQIADNIRRHGKVSMNKAYTIARTEGHRITEQARENARQKAKEAGADIVKQWDSTMDKRTRKTHAMLDGQIRELDEPFEVNGHKAMYPGAFGIAKEDINCRCACLQRAKWALDEEELNTLKERAEYFGIDKSKDFDDFKQKYLKLLDKTDKMKLKDTFYKPINSSDEHYQKCKAMFEKANVSYVPIKRHTKKMTDDEIIKTLAGWDKTDGSCASVGFAYLGQKLGFDVRDFRGGKSMKIFRSWDNLESFVKMEGLKVLRTKGACSLTVGNRLLKQVEEGKEYYLCVGRHASIVRKKDGVLQYLELQASLESGVGGWKNFNGNPKYTLNHRFGCTNTSNSWHEKLDFMIDLDNSEFNEDEIQSLLGFINTNVGEEMKGEGGNIK